MAQHFLHRPEIRAGIEQVGGEGVAEGMDPQSVRAYQVEGPMHQALHAPGRQPPAPPAHEDRPAVGARANRKRLAHQKIAAERPDRPRTHRHDPLLPSLAAHLHLVRQQVHRIERKAAQFGEADAGRVEELDDRKVAERREVVPRRARLERGEQLVHLPALQVARQPLRNPRHPRGARHRRIHAVMQLQEPVEAPHRGESARGRSLG